MLSSDATGHLSSSNAIRDQLVAAGIESWWEWTERRGSDPADEMSHSAGCTTQGCTCGVNRVNLSSQMSPRPRILQSCPRSRSVGAVCHMWSSPLFRPQKTSSSRSSLLLAATGSPMRWTRASSSPTSRCWGAVCHMFQSAPSVPRAKTETAVPVAAAARRVSAEAGTSVLSPARSRPSRCAAR